MWRYSSIFLNDACQIANFLKLYVMVKLLPNESVNAYFWIVMNEIFHILMYKCLHKLMHHIQTSKIPTTLAVNLSGSLVTITYRCLPNCQLGKTFRKTFVVATSKMPLFWMWFYLSSVCTCQALWVCKIIAYFIWIVQWKFNHKWVTNRST